MDQHQSLSEAYITSIRGHTVKITESLEQCFTFCFLVCERHMGAVHNGLADRDASIGNSVSVSRLAAQACTA